MGLPTICFQSNNLLYFLLGLFTAVTDGAVNQLQCSLGDEKDKYIPNIITGDFDSAEPAVLDYYKKKVVFNSLNTELEKRELKTAI